MRDLIIVAICVFGSLVALRKPWIGVLVWTWLSLMNPHRYAWGFAYDAPLAAMSASKAGALNCSPYFSSSFPARARNSLRPMPSI